MFAKENFDARTSGFSRLNEDKFVLVRNDHRVVRRRRLRRVKRSPIF
jgi:hypothetical protein